MSNDKKPVSREYKSLREINKENNRQFKVNRAQIKQDLRAQKKENKIIKKQDKLNYINEHGRLKYHATQGRAANWVKSQVKQSVPFQSVQQGIYALDDKYQKTKARVTNLRDGIKESGGLKKYAGQSVKNKVINSKAGRAVTKGKKIAGHIKNAPANIKKGLKEYNPVALGKKGASSVKNLGADLSTKGLKATALNRAGRLGGAIGKTKLGKNVINGVKGAANAMTNRFRAVMNALNKAKTFVVAFKIPILIGLAIITILETVVPAAIATTSELGTSPHYYCNMDAPKEVKESEIWKRYCSGGISVLQDVDENGIPTVPFYVQFSGYGYLNPDTKQYEHDYGSSYWPTGGSKMGPDSCGPSCASMILSYYTGELIFPDDEIFRSNPHYQPGGTAFAAQMWMAKQYDIETEMHWSGWSIDALDKELSEGNFVVICVGTGTHSSINDPSRQWTTLGHYITIIGKLDDGTYAIAESGSRTRSYWGETYVHQGEKVSVDADALIGVGSNGETIISENGAYLVYYTPDELKR